MDEKSWELMPHQKEYLKRASRVKRDLYPGDTGTGKTLIQLCLIDRMKRETEIRALVLLPIGPIESWLEQAEFFFPELKIFTIAKYKKAPYYRETCRRWGIDPKGNVEALKCKLRLACDAILINPELVKKYLGSFRGWNIIIDESDMLCNYKPKRKGPSPTSNIVDFAMTEFANSPHIYMFSATPADTIFQLYAQMELIQPGVFGNYRKFQAAYGEVDVGASKAVQRQKGFPITIYKARSEGWEAVAEQVKGICGHLIAPAPRKRDILKDLPPFVEIPWTVDPVTGMPKEYRYDLKNHKNAHKICPGGFLDETIRYQQIASGFLYAPTDEETGEPEGETEYFVHKKMDAVDAILARHPDDKFIIWINFIEEVSQLLKHLGRYQCGICSNHRLSKGTQWEVDFFKRKARFLIAHPGTIGRGVDGLQKFCHLNIGYGPQWQHRVYHQMSGRTDRNGQTAEQTLFYQLCTVGTIEPHVWKSMRQKKDFSDFLLKG